MRIHNCEQYSEEWWRIRNGKPSGSKSSCIVTSKGKISESVNDYAIELANALYSGRPINDFGGNKYTKRGSELEQDASLDYEMTYQVSTDFVGIITDDMQTYCSSPDRLVGDNGMLEIKCLSGKEHTKVLMYLNKYNKCPSKYYSQCQMELMTSDRRWNDLYFFHPDLPSATFRVLPNLQFFEALKSNIIYVNMKKIEILKMLKQQ